MAQGEKTAAGANRIESLDQFRGWAIFAMILGHPSSRLQPQAMHFGLLSMSSVIRFAHLGHRVPRFPCSPGRMRLY